MNETQRMLKILNEAFPKIAEMEPLAARRAVDARIRPTENIDDAQAYDEAVTVEGREIPIRVYTPEGGALKGSPVAVYGHGGGFLHGSIESHDSFCRLWAKNTRMTTVSVGYRKAPEWGAPAPAEDLLATADWARANLGERIILAGDSSGAGAALVAALMAQESGVEPLAGLVLLYPFLDPARSFPSHECFGEGFFITADAVEMYWKTYLEAPGSAEAKPWQINPLEAASFRGFPPTIVVTAGLDTLQDEGRIAYQRMRQDGVDAVLHHFPDQFHGFMTIWGYRPARAGQDVLWSSIKRLFLPRGN